MKAALIGLMQSGKSTLWSALTGREPAPPGSPRALEAAAAVPDERIDWLARLYRPKKTTYAAMDCVDLPGFSFVDAGGRAAARRLFDQARPAELLVLVVRAFPDAAAAPYRGRVDPAADLAELQTELLLADLEMAATRIERLEKQAAKHTPDQERQRAELELHRRLQEGLEAGRPVRRLIESESEYALIKSLGLLTLKPMMIVVNVGEDALGEPLNLTADAVMQDAPEPLPVCAKLESELAQLDAESRREFMAELGVEEPVVNRFVRQCYEAMGLISFLTVGPDEVRAWPIRRGTTAVEAAGKVHSDIQRGFIRAETISYDDLRALGDEKAVRAAGKARLEGKTYVVQDGDIIDFRFSV